jgi:hypothetical protein
MNQAIRRGLRAVLFDTLTHGDEVIICLFGVFRGFPIFKIHMPPRFAGAEGNYP